MGNKKPCHLSGAGLKKTGFKLFSLALPPGPPYQGRVQVLNNECGYEAIRNNGNRGRARGKNAGLQHHWVAHQHCAWKIPRNKYMSNALGVPHFLSWPTARSLVLHFVFGPLLGPQK